MSNFLNRGPIFRIRGSAASAFPVSTISKFKTFITLKILFFIFEFYNFSMDFNFICTFELKMSKTNNENFIS